MLSGADFFGGQTNLNTAVDNAVDLRFRFWRINISTTSKVISLPPRTLAGVPVGGPVFIIANVGSNNFNLRDFELADTAVTLTPNQACIISSFDNAGVTRWAYHVRNYASY